MCQTNIINETLLFDLTQIAKFMNEVISGINKVGFDGLNKSDIEWYKKNEFKLKIQALFLNQIKNEAYIIFSKRIQNQEPELSKLGLKFIALTTIGTSISKLAYIIYDSPGSELTKELLLTPLKDERIIIEKWYDNGAHSVKIEWKNYINSINTLTNFYKNEIETRETKVGDEK